MKRYRSWRYKRKAREWEARTLTALEALEAQELVAPGCARTFRDCPWPPGRERMDALMAFLGSIQYLLEGGSGPVAALMFEASSPKAKR